MKRMTKLLSLMLAALMLVGMLPLGVWAAGETHTVRFNLNYNGAPKLSDQQVADGDYATQPEGVVRDGWHFSYWYVKRGNNQIEKFDLATTPITTDVTLYARWTEDTLARAEKMAQGLELSKRMEEKEEETGEIYTVTFIANGDGVEKLPKPQKVKSGECAVMPNIPQKANYAFGGWYTDAACTDIFDFSTPITNDITLYAFWFVYNEDMEVLAEALRAVRIGYATANNADCVTQNITLPTEVRIDGFNTAFVVNWSSDSSAIVIDGTVSRSRSDNIQVTLTAEISYKGESASRKFTLVVIKDNQEVPIIVDDIEDMCQFNEEGIVPDVYLDDNDNISNIDGVFSNVTVNCCEDAILAIESVKKILGIENSSGELTPSNTVNSNYSNSYTVQQMYKGIPVYGRTITVSTTLEGTPNYLNTGYLSNLDVNTSPVLLENNIVEILVADYNSEYTYNVDGLTIYSINEYVDAPALAYIVKATNADGEFVENLIVNSDNGNIIYKEVSEIYWGDANVVGKGKDELGNERTFTIRFKQWDWFFYYMQDIDRNIMVYNKKISAWNRVGSELNWWTDKTENSAYANLIEVYDWYNDTLNYNSIDGNGLALNLVVHQEGGKDNAYYSDSSCGGDDGLHFYDNSKDNDSWVHTPAAGLDVIAHEFTHGVFRYKTGGVPYSNSTGAINEAYADIFGCLVEGNWVVGEDLTGTSGGLRNISDPSSMGYPEQYLIDPNWVPYVAIPDNTNDRGGVHTNTTVISYAAYLMNQAGISMSVLADLWFESMSLGYTATSEFFNVRLNVIHAAKEMGLTANQLQIINKAFNDVNIRVGYSLSGKITIADGDTDMTNNLPLQGARVRLTGNNVIKSAITDVNGNYKINSIPYGTYTVTVSKVGYITVTQTLDFDYTMEEIYNVAIEAIPEEFNGDGIASGYVYDVATGLAVPNLTLYVRDGLNNTVGSSFMKLTTNADGMYSTFSIPAGNYTVQIVDERTGISEDARYITSSFNIKILGGMTIGNQNGYVSNSITTEEIRIVLTWGATPSDLDSHLVGPDAAGGKFHVYYSNKSYGSEVDLDVDDTSSYGPETITIHSTRAGTYTYAVHDYSNRSSSYSTALSNSGAQINVYKGAKLIATYNVPANKDGTLWTVFTYNGATGQITPVNTMTYDSSSGGSLLNTAALQSVESTVQYNDIYMLMMDDVLANVK